MALIVRKFGGASIGNTEAVKQMISVVRQGGSVPSVLVFSALGKTTRRLLACARSAADGDLGCIPQTLSAVFTEHRDIAAALIPKAASKPGYQLLETYETDLLKTMHGLSEIRELSDKIQDQVLAFGELMSTALMSDILRSAGIDTTLMNAGDFMITDDRHTCARPRHEICDLRIAEQIRPVIDRGSIPVVQGFIGRCVDGRQTTLGFEGSDYSAAIIAAALNASALEVWKNVPGIMTADPEFCAGARIVSYLTYKEAAALSSSGARVLHPDTLAPVSKASIPVAVKSAVSPASAGTLIGNESHCRSDRLISISQRPQISVITVTLKSGISAGEGVREVCRWLERNRQQPFFIHAGSGHVTCGVDTGTTGLPHCRFLQQTGNLTEISSMACISLVGGCFQHAAVLGDLFSILADRQISLLSQGMSPFCLTLGVRRSDMEYVINRLHDYFFSSTQESQ